LHSLIRSLESVIIDSSYIVKHLERIRNSINSDPELAIGSTKELIETVLKTILEDAGEDIRNKDIPQLLRSVQKVLGLLPDSADSFKKGTDTIKRLLSNLGQIVICIDELRNLYGTGHGKTKLDTGIEAHHARLVVGAGATLATFLMELHEGIGSGVPKPKTKK